ncbi:glycoside hydrolase [Phyllosticta capitalensis]
MKLNSYPLLLTSVAFSSALSLDPTNRDSVTTAAKQIASGAFSYYTTQNAGVGLFPGALFWESGSAWNALINYWFLTGDTTYNTAVQSALQAQSMDGFQPANQSNTMTNDEQAIWALTAVSALERGFPSIDGTSYLSLAVAAFDSLEARWDTTDTDSCGIPAGGLRWSPYPFNVGYDYMNTLSTALFFQLSARLARYTGNVTYTETAAKAYNWLEKSGLVDASGAVYDGFQDYSSSSTSSSSGSSSSSSSSTSCASSSNINRIQWSNSALALLHGTLVLSNMTTEPVWRSRSLTLLSSIESVFYPASPSTVPATSTNGNASVLVESACEPIGTCNSEQVAFKGLAARWLAWSSVAAPSGMNIPARVASKVGGSASAAAQRCANNNGKMLCTGRWFDASGSNVKPGDISGNTGFGQQLSALEAVLAPLVNGSIVLERMGTRAVSTTNGTAVATLTGTASATAMKTVGVSQLSGGARGARVGDLSALIMLAVVTLVM